MYSCFLYEKETSKQYIALLHIVHIHIVNTDPSSMLKISDTGTRPLERIYLGMEQQSVIRLHICVHVNCVIGMVNSGVLHVDMTS